MAAIGVWFYDCTSQQPVRNNPRSNEESQPYDETEIYPVRQQHNTFDPFEWQLVACPSALEGSLWPPTCVDQLTNECNPELNICLVCNMYTACICLIDEWRLHNNCILASVLEHSHISNMVLCQPHNGITRVERPVLYIDVLYVGDISHARLFTYKNIPKGQIIGEMTGKLRPAAFVSASREDFDVWGWFIGTRDWARLHPKAPDEVVLDCTVASSAMKFLSHSCTENCAVFWGRVGRTRGLFVRTIKDIPAHAQLTIWDQRRIQDQSTHCGTSNCQCARRIQRSDSVITISDPAEEEGTACEAEAPQEGGEQRRLREAEEQPLGYVDTVETPWRSWNMKATEAWRPGVSGMENSISQHLAPTNLCLAEWEDLCGDSDVMGLAENTP